MANKKTRLLGDVKKQNKKKTPLKKENFNTKKVNQISSNIVDNKPSKIKYSFIFIFLIFIITFILIPKPNEITYSGHTGKQTAFYLPPFILSNKTTGKISDSQVYNTVLISGDKLTMCSTSSIQSQCYKSLIIEQKSFIKSAIPYLKHLKNQYF